MIPSVKERKKAWVQPAQCVACGACVGSCPRGAIRVVKGVFAQVDPALCVGCGKCMGICPAGAIRQEGPK